jgi:hypothetical protein
VQLGLLNVSSILFFFFLRYTLLECHHDLCMSIIERGYGMVSMGHFFFSRKYISLGQGWVTRGCRHDIEKAYDMG